MLYLAIAIIAVSIPFVSLVFKKVRNGFGKGEIISLIFTFLISFSGLFFAIFLTNLSEKDKEKKDVIKLLEASKIEIERTIYLSIGAFLHEKPFSNVSINLENVAYTIKRDKPTREIYFTSKILDNEITLRTISSTSLERFINQINLYEYNYKRAFMLMEEDVDNYSWYYSYKEASEHLYYLYSQIEREIEYLRREISKEELKHWGHEYENKTPDEISTEIMEQIFVVAGKFMNER